MAIDGIDRRFTAILCADVGGMPCISGVPELKAYKPARNAVVVIDFIEAGAVIFGKANLPVFPQIFKATTMCTSRLTILGTFQLRVRIQTIYADRRILPISRLTDGTRYFFS